MKTPSNFAATTLALCELLQKSMPPGVEVTTLAPATAEKFSESTACLSRVNVALLTIRQSRHGRKLSPERPGAFLSEPPLVVELDYLVTAYGAAGPAEPHSVQRMLEAVLATLHTHPVLTPTGLQAALAGHVINENVTVTLVDQSDSELMNLFTSCQAQWRPALRYRAQVLMPPANLQASL